MVEIFPNLMTDTNIDIQWAQQTPSKMTSETHTVTIKLWETKRES